MRWWLEYPIAAGGSGAFAYATSRISKHVSDIWRFKISSKLVSPGSKIEVDKDGSFTITPPSLQEAGQDVEYFFRETFGEILNECIQLWPVEISQAEEWINSTYFQILNNWDFYRTQDIQNLREVLSELVLTVGSSHFPPQRLMSILSKSSQPGYYEAISRLPPETKHEKIREVTRYVISLLSLKEREIFREFFHGSNAEQIAEHLRTDACVILACEKRIGELFDEACREAGVIDSCSVSISPEIPITKVPPRTSRNRNPKPGKKRRRGNHEAPQGQPQPSERRKHVGPHQKLLRETLPT